MNRKRGSDVLVGDLLVGAKLVSADQLSAAMPMSQKTGLPIGRVLVEAGLLTNQIVRAAVLAQSLIRDNLLHIELAIKGLRIAADNNSTLEEALATFGWRSEYYERTNKLGDLLVESGCLSEQQLADAFEVCFATGLPLGRVLVLRQVLPEVVAYAALTAQVLMREGRLTRQQSLEVVREAKSRSGSTPSAMRLDFGRFGGGEQKIRIGELLIAAGIVAEIDLVSAVERAIVEERPIGQVLINAGLITTELLQSALVIQHKVNARTIKLPDAVRMLKGEPLRVSAQLPDERTNSPPRSLEDMDVPELLRTAGLATELNLPKIARELILQKENLAYKIVQQQEEIKNRLARELHDTIVADLMMLKRFLSGDRQLSPKETIEIVDHIIRQCRDICWDFAPRQLQDLGLEASLADLLERVQRRTGMNCKLVCDTTLPHLPEPVKLHIFRVLQECMNNVEKYSGASNVVVLIEQPEERQLRFIVSDNGKGFETESAAERRDDGGMGMGSMRERAELIRCYFPTRLKIESEPGKGTRVILDVSAR
jgi:signal transduction histidine kinase